MSITYSFEIVAVDLNARCMEILYTSGNHTPHRIGARLPYAGETLEQVVKMYSPVSFWEAELLAVVAPSVGETGVIVPEEPPQLAAMLQAQPTTTGSQTL